MRNTGSALAYASTELQNDRGFLLAAVRHNGYVLSEVDVELREDQYFLLYCLSVNPELFSHSYRHYYHGIDPKDMMAVINQRLLDLDYCNQFRESYRQLDTVVKKKSRFDAFFRGSDNNNNDVILPRLRSMGHKLTQKIIHPKVAMPGAAFEKIASCLAIKDGMSLKRALGKYWDAPNHESVLERDLADLDAVDAGSPNAMMSCGLL